MKDNKRRGEAMGTINEKSMSKLLLLYAEDKALLDILYDALKSFEEYHFAVYSMEAWTEVYSYKALEKAEYQDQVTEMDRRRTVCHNAVLSSVNILNRFAEEKNLPLVYDGTVSEDIPYRKEVADAVLEYVENKVRKRR